MRKACWIWLVAVSLASVGILRADEKPMFPRGATPIEEQKKQAIKPPSMNQAPKHMSQTRLGLGDFFRKLFGPDEPKINGAVIGGTKMYKNAISPVAPIVPR